MNAVGELRLEIDECDRRLAELLARRSIAVAAIRDLKIKYCGNGQVEAAERRDRLRERNVIFGVIARMRATGGRYDEETITNVYELLFAGSERLEAAVPRPVYDGDRGRTGY